MAYFLDFQSFGLHDYHRVLPIMMHGKERQCPASTKADSSSQHSKIKFERYTDKETFGLYSGFF
jgi:hypothetical protein